jgi:hypothetical protein
VEVNAEQDAKRTTRVALRTSDMGEDRAALRGDRDETCVALRTSDTGENRAAVQGDRGGRKVNIAAEQDAVRQSRVALRTSDTGEDRRAVRGEREKKVTAKTCKKEVPYAATQIYIEEELRERNPLRRRENAEPVEARFGDKLVRAAAKGVDPKKLKASTKGRRVTAESHPAATATPTPTGTGVTVEVLAAQLNALQVKVEAESQADAHTTSSATKTSVDALAAQVTADAIFDRALEAAHRDVQMQAHATSLAAQRIKTVQLQQSQVHVAGTVPGVVVGQVVVPKKVGHAVKASGKVVLAKAVSAGHVAKASGKVVLAKAVSVPSLTTAASSGHVEKDHSDEYTYTDAESSESSSL